jgi:hypothetical protein
MFHFMPKLSIIATYQREIQVEIPIEIQQNPEMLKQFAQDQIDMADFDSAYLEWSSTVVIDEQGEEILSAG